MTTTTDIIAVATIRDRKKFDQLLSLCEVIILLDKENELLKDAILKSIDYRRKLSKELNQ